MEGEVLESIVGPVRSEYGRLGEPGVAENSGIAQEKGGPHSVSQYNTKSNSIFFQICCTQETSRVS